ncbi:MAG: D-alanine--D-alanine ligase family protein [Rhodothermales bacterium]
MERHTGMLIVGVVFGGVSPEHEVSIISSLQAMHALDRSRYRPVPIYIAKDGTWYTGKVLEDVEAFQDLNRVRREATPVRPARGPGSTLRLLEEKRGGFFSRRPEEVRVDVMFLGLHGGSGEDGGLQGLCETFNVPYTGSTILGSALGMDKVLSKRVCRDRGIPVVDFVAIRESQWARREEEWLDRCEAKLGYPAIVKPSRLGSSIGISMGRTRDELDRAVEDAFRYDSKIVVEYAVTDLKEINCAVLGDADEAVASVLEEPVRASGEDLLTFQEKYMRDEGGGKSGGAKDGSGGPAGMASLDRIIPAPVDEDTAQRLREMAVGVFQLFECGGVARIDFMIDGSDGTAYFNEINTIPGSFSFYLWEPSGVPFDELVHRMIELARRRHRTRSSRIRTYDVNLLSEKSLRGIKGSKGS